MKKILVVLTFFSFSFSSLASEVYLLAPDTKIMSVENSGTTKTVVKLSYLLPCWADYVGLIKKTVDIGDPVSPVSNFEVALGVLIKGDKINPCIGSTLKTITSNLNTFSVEGKFYGFKVMDSRY